MSRNKRISSLLQSEISALLLKKINDKRIGFISITYVKLSKDMAHAWVYYSQIGNESEKKDTMKGLSSATPFIHSELTKKINYMAIPKLHFRFDSSLENAVNIINKIDNLSK